MDHVILILSMLTATTIGLRGGDGLPGDDKILIPYMHYKVHCIPSIMNGHAILCSSLAPVPLAHIISILLVVSAVGEMNLNTDVILVSLLSMMDALYIPIALYCSSGLVGISCNWNCALDSVLGTIHVIKVS